MGHRANFITIRDGVGVAFYDQWAALGCLFAFAAGPEEAVAALQGMEQTEELLDWAFAEGGYLLDFDNNTAIAFGYLDIDGPEEMEGDSSKEVAEVVTALERGGPDFLQHIAPRWKGWLLKWDDRGVDAFSAYLRQRNITGITCQPDSHPPDRTSAELSA
jgi:hypothetical protein